ncbi:hypothetical protein RintRC_0657 [Richelia intracellularis]|nr:hypothetical protein RintRC_0657 [Richelia intracellularis]
MGYLDSTALAGNLFFKNYLIFGFEDLKPVGASLLVRDSIRLTRSVQIDPLRP